HTSQYLRTPMKKRCSALPSSGRAEEISDHREERTVESIARKNITTTRMRNCPPAEDMLSSTDAATAATRFRSTLSISPVSAVSSTPRVASQSIRSVYICWKAAEYFG